MFPQGNTERRLEEVIKLNIQQNIEDTHPDNHEKACRMLEEFKLLMNDFRRYRQNISIKKEETVCRLVDLQKEVCYFEDYMSRLQQEHREYNESIKKGIQFIEDYEKSLGQIRQSNHQSNLEDWERLIEAMHIDLYRKFHEDHPEAPIEENWESRTGFVKEHFDAFMEETRGTFLSNQTVWNGFTPKEQKRLATFNPKVNCHDMWRMNSSHVENIHFQYQGTTTQGKAYTLTTRVSIDFVHNKVRNRISTSAANLQSTLSRAMNKMKKMKFDRKGSADGLYTTMKKAKTNLRTLHTVTDQKIINSTIQRARDLISAVQKFSNKQRQRTSVRKSGRGRRSGKKDRMYWTLFLLPRLSQQTNF